MKKLFTILTLTTFTTIYSSNKKITTEKNKIKTINGISQPLIRDSKQSKTFDYNLAISKTNKLQFKQDAILDEKKIVKEKWEFNVNRFVYDLEITRLSIWLKANSNLKNTEVYLKNEIRYNFLNYQRDLDNWKDKRARAWLAKSEASINKLNKLKPIIIMPTFRSKPTKIIVPPLEQIKISNPIEKLKPSNPIQKLKSSNLPPNRFYKSKTYVPPASSSQDSVQELQLDNPIVVKFNELMTDLNRQNLLAYTKMKIADKFSFINLVKQKTYNKQGEVASDYDLALVDSNIDQITLNDLDKVKKFAKNEEKNLNIQHHNIENFEWSKKEMEISFKENVILHKDKSRNPINSRNSWYNIKWYDMIIVEFKIAYVETEIWLAKFNLDLIAIEKWEKEKTHLIKEFNQLKTEYRKTWSGWFWSSLLDTLERL